jgi:2-polyprenyl-3-methyl-5-hydroxy-6-metoxy-1,4-benzoquinol methylase
LALVYDRIAARRKPYLESIDQLIVDSIPHPGGAMLDVGAGDGARSRRIAAAAGIDRLVMLEPSLMMRSRPGASGEFLDIRAESLDRVEARFDVVTCLWNVLGHIFPESSRIEVLRQFARIVSPGGRIFIDVNHRYNLRHYGIPMMLRFIRDHGDVVVAWNVEGTVCRTAGHVFTHREFAALCRAAGLSIERRYVVDYGSGELRRMSFMGNLLYVLRSATPSGSSAAGRKPWPHL